jgi:hypothetical protein
MRYKSLALKRSNESVSLLFLDIYPAVDALGMWESRRDFQAEGEGWKAGILAFHA